MYICTYTYVHNNIQRVLYVCVYITSNTLSIMFLTNGIVFINHIMKNVANYPMLTSQLTFFTNKNCCNHLL